MSEYMINDDWKIPGPRPLKLNTESQGKRCNSNSTPPGLGTLRSGFCGKAPPERGASAFFFRLQLIKG